MKDYDGVVMWPACFAQPAAVECEDWDSSKPPATARAAPGVVSALWPGGPGGPDGPAGIPLPFIEPSALEGQDALAHLELT